MSSQTHFEAKGGGIKRRHVYLRKKVQAYAKMFFGAIATLFCGGLSLLFVYTVAHGSLYDIIIKRSFGYRPVEMLTHLAIYSSWAGFFAVAAWLGARLCRSAAKAAASLTVDAR